MDTGQLFDNKYKMLKKLGQGGTSKVFLAEHAQLKTLWAIKEIQKKQNQHIDLAAEPNAMKNLRHPSLPRIFDIQENDDFLYIIQDYIEGDNLNDLIREEGAFKEERVLKWAKQITDVYLYLHNLKPNPLIYRDMKPSNLIVDSKDNIKIIDFGIAREYKADATEDTTMLGTRGYASPEQYGASQSDSRSDIYSLGITLYYLLTGISPNHRTFDLTLLKRVPYISKEMTDVIEKCTQYHSEKRYQDAESLMKDLNEINRDFTHEYMEKRYKSISTTQIAFVGATGGCGTTHTTFLFANILRKHYKVAVVEMNTSQDLKELQYSYSGSVEGNVFRIKNVDYYKSVDEVQLIEISNQKYDFILLDLGSYQDMYDFDTFLRADIKIIMTHGSDWKTKHLHNFYKELGSRDIKKEWKICIPFIPIKILDDFTDDYKNDIFTIPFHVNPFKLSKEIDEELIRIIEKITKLKLFNKKTKLKEFLKIKNSIFQK